MSHFTEIFAKSPKFFLLKFISLVYITQLNTVL